MAYDRFEYALQSPPSSPPRQASPMLESKKLKKPPPITPKRFTRFFTPRTASLASCKSTHSRSSRQLRDITRVAVNQQTPKHHKTPRKNVFFSEDDSAIECHHTPHLSSNRKRKHPLSPPPSSPVQQTPSKRLRFERRQPEFEIREDADTKQIIKPHDDFQNPVPIRRLRASNTHRLTLERSFGDSSIGRGRLSYRTDWQLQTEGFHSRPEDVYASQNGVPFCSTSCNTNSLIAVGDEDGNISILETDTSRPFSQTQVTLRPHGNAIMDLAFSSDDRYLATASGDQTAQIIDMQTQKSRFSLEKHRASVKQICFQPGNDHFLATSSRDGTVQLWDLRCSGSNGSPKAVFVQNTSYNTIDGAHTERPALASSSSSNFVHMNVRDIAGKTETPSRRGEASITSLQFLKNGREHLLLTASDGSATIKLWDIRSRYSRRGPATALAVTRQPESHNRHRNFGINSLCLSGDGARFYSLSKDNTLYAYSTNHIILGNAFEFSTTTSRPRHLGKEKDGLGPLYGFRHSKFHATSFYVKASLRPAVGDKPEMLAVGSSDGSPVLFPTDEKLLSGSSGDNKERVQSFSTTIPSSPLVPQPILHRNISVSNHHPRMKDTIPIYEQGTPLIRGHTKEVTSVAWTHQGDLVSVSDDFTVRCWREDAATARNLRSGGEGEGRRWGSGWAEMNSTWEDDE
ncbi:WD40 repeat-like protein [Pseudovirgaria hyperparasitica]|uniref:WD40 repeat-like protein n=1 Tax=Pseudovirgaria hyperparasitica TaxID=470096 RepID=A0A6A6WK70_9PEZI|nr:WD40 repeat-like protein [Pseudovirgaria hyperparasitica]KAF2762568.1 WD40 repeat-like protein [Pseudovirgaria hyperparasitica]